MGGIDLRAIEDAPKIAAAKLYSLGIPQICELFEAHTEKTITIHMKQIL